MTLLVSFHPAHAQPDDVGTAKTPGDESGDAWHISADAIVYDEKEDAYLAQGAVTISRQGRTLTADQVRFNRKTNQADAEGNVILVQGLDRLSGSSMTINLDSETGFLENGALFIEQNHLYVTGDKIYKTGPETYRIHNAGLTSCDDPNPAWRLTTRDLEVTLEGYGQATHAALWAKKIPLLYTPYLVFPVKTKRQSGFLIPELGYADRKGEEYLQPFFWAIDDNHDATFYAHYMGKRGLRAGTEYRYVLASESMGTLMADGFIDRQRDDGGGDTSERWGYTDDGFLRPNADRYWLRGKADQALPGGLNAKLDIDVVSDQDYLHEFRNGANGFDNTRSYFTTTFGRDLDDYNDPVRRNALNLSRIWRLYSFNTDVRWHDDVVKRRQADTDDTLQHLPSVSFGGLRQSMAGSPFYFDLSADYVHFYRQTGERGHRMDVYPRVYYPFFVLEGIAVEPSAGLRQTLWRIDHRESPGAADRNDYERALYDFKLDARTEFFRFFDTNTAGFDRVRHAVTPEITYTYLPDKDQKDYPYFDALDRIKHDNLITYGLTNTLTGRYAAPKGARAKTAMDYVTFFRFNVLHGFDISKYNQNDERPFTDIAAELDITPGRYIALDADGGWSPYDNWFTYHNAALSLWDARADRLDIIYRYTRETEKNKRDGIESLALQGEWVADDHWRLRGGYEFNLYDEKEIESRLGISYKAQCWAVDIDYTVEENDASVTVMFHLMNIGSIGN